jgi:magnesium chelatase subunit D
LPVAEQEEDEPPQPEAESTPPEDAPDEESETSDALPEDILVAAAQAALPPELLTRLLAGTATRSSASMPGGAGAQKDSGARGRPIGVRQGVPGPRARLDVVDTLRAAAPWQRLRLREQGGVRSGRIEVRKSDLRVKRFRQRTETLAIFVVDASGSAALQRLSEAKGAVELLLAECYVRRDQVALLAFRGREAQLLLPPTRSLVRAKRSLAGLPGGGGTPLAAGIQSAIELARVERQRGRTPVVVLLTDGRANIARDGRADRTQAQTDALAAARALRAEGLAGVLVDTALRPQADAERLAREMDAIYVPLPQANANALMRTVRQATGGAGRNG